MKKITVMLIVLMMIGIGFLSGCNELNEKSSAITVESTSFYAQPGQADYGCFCVLLYVKNVPDLWKFSSVSCTVYGNSYFAGEGNWEYSYSESGGYFVPSLENKSVNSMFMAPVGTTQKGTTLKIVAYYRIKGTVNGTTDQFFWDLNPELEKAINEQTAIEWLVRGYILFYDEDNLPVDIPIDDLINQQIWY